MQEADDGPGAPVFAPALVLALQPFFPTVHMCLRQHSLFVWHYSQSDTPCHRRSGRCLLRVWSTRLRRPRTRSGDRSRYPASCACENRVIVLGKLLLLQGLLLGVCAAVKCVQVCVPDADPAPVATSSDKDAQINPKQAILRRTTSLPAAPSSGQRT
jgi:hypothetical protein